MLACGSVCWVNISSDTENAIKNCLTCIEFWATQPEDKLIQHYIPGKPWETVGVDIFMLNNKTFLYCRLPQLLPYCEADWWTQCPKSNHPIQS